VIRRRTLLAGAISFLVLGTGPTVGDVGGCGRTATDLNEEAFARARKTTDCARCNDCGLSTDKCTRACDDKAPSDVQFPSTCRPILHDGEVCLRALKSASCSDYATYVDDQAPAVPSECDFCHEEAP
jgi:hypothetical protein